MGRNTPPLRWFFSFLTIYLITCTVSFFVIKLQHRNTKVKRTWAWWLAYSVNRHHHQRMPEGWQINQPRQAGSTEFRRKEPLAFWSSLIGIQIGISCMLLHMNQCTITIPSIWIYLFVPLQNYRNFLLSIFFCPLAWAKLAS